MLVMKFGGTSLGNAEAMNLVLERIVSVLNTQEPILIVLSALSEVTNQLTTLSLTKNFSIIKSLYERHAIISKILISDNHLLKQFLEDLDNYCWGLKQDLNTEEIDDRLTAKILAYGELISSTLVHYALLAKTKHNLWIDARNLITTDYNFLKAKVDFKYSLPRIKQILQQHFRQYQIIITQGFIAGTKDNLTTLLGREGSDYSATILGSALHAREVQIFTDTDGIMSIDPKISPARLIEHLTYDEANELSTFGAKIIHPLTMSPVKFLNIPIRILNSFNKSLYGTTVNSNPGKFFISINYLKEITVLRFQIKNKTNITKLGIYLNQHRDEIHFSSLTNDQILIIMQRSIWNKLKINRYTWLNSLISENNSSLIAITVGGKNNNWLTLLNSIIPHFEKIHLNELVFSVSKKSLLLTVQEEHMENTLMLLHKKLIGRMS